MKPAYVTVEFWRESRDDVATIEGWLTNDDDKYLFVTPTLDYDVEVMKFAIPNEKIISIIPAQSVRDYGVAETRAEAAQAHSGKKRIGWRVTHIPTGKTIERENDGEFGIAVVNELANELLKDKPMGTIPISDFKTEPIYAAD